MTYSIRELWSHNTSARAAARAELMREGAGTCERLSDMDVAAKWIEEVATGLGVVAEARLVGKNLPRDEGGDSADTERIPRLERIRVERERTQSRRGTRGALRST